MKSHLVHLDITTDLHSFSWCFIMAQMLHGAGILAPTFTLKKWPSFVGEYSITPWFASAFIKDSDGRPHWGVSPSRFLRCPWASRSHGWKVGRDGSHMATVGCPGTVMAFESRLIYADILYCLWYSVDYNRMSTWKPHRSRTGLWLHGRLETRQSVPSVWPLVAKALSHSISF